MDFGKIFFVFGFLIFGSWGFGQGDTNLIQVTISEPELLTIDDSLIYSQGDFSQIEIDFECHDSLNATKFFFELIEQDENNYSQSIVLYEYSLTELDSLGQFVDDSVSFTFIPVVENLKYLVTVRIEDVYGHQVYYLSKIIEL